MSELWEAAFTTNAMMWGTGPAKSTLLARDRFVAAEVREVLIPGVGYGRNAKPFLDAGMAVTGIEISPTAIELARAEMKLEFPIYRGSVTDMPFDELEYGGIFCYGLVYLLDAEARAKLIRDCYNQLAPSGVMMFTVISKAAPMYGRGTPLGEDWFEIQPDLKMFFYDRASIEREFAHGLVDISEIDEPAGGGTFPFFNVVCEKRRTLER